MLNWLSAHLRVADVAVHSHRAQVLALQAESALIICAVLQGAARRLPLAPFGAALPCHLPVLFT